MSLQLSNENLALENMCAQVKDTKQAEQAEKAEQAKQAKQASKLRKLSKPNQRKAEENKGEAEAFKATKAGERK